MQTISQLSTSIACFLIKIPWGEIETGREIMQQVMFSPLLQFNICSPATFSPSERKSTHSKTYAYAVESLTRAHWSEAVLPLDWSKKKSCKCAEEDKPGSVSSVQGKDADAVFAPVKKGLSWQHPSLPDQPRCVIDLCFCFTPAIPKKVEVLKKWQTAWGSERVCQFVYSSCVCVDGWAGVLTD